jgi:hypothetical protein
MIKTMNWGTKLLLGLASFMIFIVALVIIMFNSKKDALVDNDYYEKGINYDKEYQLKEQTKADHAKPLISTGPEVIVMAFTAKAIGTVHFMRTADKSMDQVLPFESNAEHQVVIPSGILKKGSWRLIIDWRSLDKKYLYEQEINIR